MISLPAWLRAPLDSMTSRLGGARWVEPSNDITRAVLASLRQPAPAGAAHLSFDSLEFEAAVAPAAQTPAATPEETTPKTGREAA